MNNIINVNNISYEYITEESTFKAIDNLNLDVKQGEFVAIIGHNGSGKLRRQVCIQRIEKT